MSPTRGVGGEAALQEFLQLAESGQRAPGRATTSAACDTPALRKAWPRPRPTRAISVDLVSAQARQARLRDRRAHTAPRRACAASAPGAAAPRAMRRSKAWVSAPSSMRIGHRVQQRRRQQALHHRQHARDVGVAAREIAIAVEIAEEEFRRRPPLRVAQEAIETGLQARDLPAPQFRQPAQTVAWLARRIVERLVPARRRRPRRPEQRISGHAAIPCRAAIGKPGRHDRADGLRDPRARPRARRVSATLAASSATPAFMLSLHPARQRAEPSDRRSRPHRARRCRRRPDRRHVRTRRAARTRRSVRRPRLHAPGLLRRRQQRRVPRRRPGQPPRHRGDVPDLHHRRQRRRAVPPGDLPASGAVRIHAPRREPAAADVRVVAQPAAAPQRFALVRPADPFRRAGADRPVRQREVERFLREVFTRRGRSNDFRELGRELVRRRGRSRQRRGGALRRRRLGRRPDLARRCRPAPPCPACIRRWRCAAAISSTAPCAGPCTPRCCSNAASTC